MRHPLLVACDFDGTVTAQDTLVEVLNRFGHPKWREIQEKVIGGELSIREGLEKQMETVRATREELQDFLTTQVELEPTFSPFLRELQRRGIPVVLLSGGFDLCVEAVLNRAGLSHLPYLANRLVKWNGSWRVEFPYPSGHCLSCGHCKGDPIRSWNAQGYTTLFVGNGVTDRCAAAQAQLTFAKDELFQWCQSQGMEAVPYQDFTDVRQQLVRRGWL